VAEELDPPGWSLSCVAFNDAASPEEGASVRLTVPEKLFRLVNVSLALPEAVALIVTVVGFDDMEKSRGGTIRCTITEFDENVVFVAMTVTLYFPGATELPTVMLRVEKS